MLTGDGWLVRVRPRAGAFSIEALNVIAETATNFGSGDIDLTSRCNLQLRGLTQDTIPHALAALGQAGLLDGTADAEQVRNIIVDSLCGIDPARTDLRELAGAVEAALVERTDLHALPSKFGVSFSGTAQPLRGPSPSDIMVAAFKPGICLIELDGDSTRGAVVTHAEAVAAVENLARVFMTHARTHNDARRMRDAVATRGSEVIFANAGLESFETSEGGTPDATPRAGVLGPAHAPYAVCIGLGFGHVTAAQLKSLCSAASAQGCAQARPSQQRTLIVPLQTRQAADALLTVAEVQGLIVRDGDARLMMDACPGAPACANGTTGTRADALQVAVALSRHPGTVPSVHISGCIKGCARRAPAALTIVARNRRYDLIINGVADGAPLKEGIAPGNLEKAIETVLADMKL